MIVGVEMKSVYIDLTSIEWARYSILPEIELKAALRGFLWSHGWRDGVELKMHSHNGVVTFVFGVENE